MKTYQSFVNCTNNLMCAVDIKTTGPDPDYHEIIQIAILPLDSELKPHRGTKPFYINIAPQFPERAKGGALIIGGLDLADLAVNAPYPDKVLDLLVDWFEQLDLPTVHRLIPLAHDWNSKARFLRKWLGNRLFEHIFHCMARDILSAAILQNDMANIRGELARLLEAVLGSTNSG